MTKTRAIAGGEYGVNGEFYQGGEFLPSSPTTVKGEVKKSETVFKPRKQQIAPYVWEVQPFENARSLYTEIEVFTQEVDGQFKIVAREKTLTYFSVDREELQTLVDEYNSGTRWI